MKRLGMIGGSTWLSTVEYYSLINRLVNERLGGIEFPECILYSVNFADLNRNVDAGRMDLNIELMVRISEKLQGAGAEAILLCANTLHLAAERITGELGLPVIHIADATTKAVQEAGITKVALLGTTFTMEGEFFTSRLRSAGIEPLIPDSKEDRQAIHDPIFNEFGKGIFSPETKTTYLRIIGDLQARGAQGAILACTEIPMLLKPEDVPIPTFDTTRIHSEAAVAYILS